MKWLLYALIIGIIATFICYINGYGYGYIYIFILPTVVSIALVSWSYNKTKKKYLKILCLIIGIEILITFIIICLFFIGIERSVSCCVSSFEVAKNNACREYLRQSPVCNSAIGVTFEYPAGILTNLVEFTNTYCGCNNTVTDESCVKRVCMCAGY